MGAFENSYSRPFEFSQEAIGHIPSEWATWLRFKGASISNEVFDGLSRSRLSRSEILSMSCDPSISTQVLVLSILSWGWMNRRHGLHLWANQFEWIAVCDQLREGLIRGDQAYEKFRSLRKDGFLKGMGPAYFTKLIYFLHPKHNRYIMDQWTGSSVNLLFSGSIVDLSPQYYVTDRNSSSTYSLFCDAVDFLARRVALAPDIVELMLFSQGGKNKHAWRKYVIDNREHHSS